MIQDNIDYTQRKLVIKEHFDFIQNVIRNNEYCDDKGNLIDFKLKKGDEGDKCYDIRFHRVIEINENYKRYSYSKLYNNGLTHKIIKLAPKSSMIVGSGVSLDMGQKIIDGVLHLLHCEVKTRSGLGFKYDIELFNGQIDNPYKKEILLKVTNNSDYSKDFFIGERIGQIDFQYKPILKDQVNYFDTIEELNKGGRDGIGSSGRG